MLHRRLIVAQRVNSRAKSSDVGYQYLQKSSLPMLHFQKSLPRLPIPALEKTCERYLAAQKPLLTPEEYKTTSSLVEAFQKDPGPTLHSYLVDTDKANKHTSYISKPWFDMYLSDRTPLPVNYNPVLIMKHDERKELNDPVIRATNLVISSLRFMKSLREEWLEPEVFHMNPAKSDTQQFRKWMKLVPNFVATYAAYAFKAFPLDMSQYQGLFEATRVPEVGKDRILRSNSARHLLVFINGHPFSVDVLDEQGNLEQPSAIFARLQHVYSSGKALPRAQLPIGALTTENRDTWANLRSHLVSIGNSEALSVIDSALFCLSFDHETTLDEENPTQVVREQLYESTNRWYDKSLSLIVTQDGTAGVNFEHSWGDGVAVLRYFNEIYKDSREKAFVGPQTRPVEANLEGSVRRIELTLDEKARQGIESAVRNHQSVVDSLDMNFLKYPGVTRDSCKKYRTSPDSIMQLAFQLAFFKQTRKFVATYESCSTAAFRHGRTETIRPCTSETQSFCEQISLKQMSKQGLRGLMDACSKKHNLLTKEAAMGQGFDRHLFGLRHTAALNGLEVPQVFQDPAYRLMNHNTISTSTLSSPALLAGGFGPVVPDGYGVGYNIQSAFAGCVVMNYRNARNGPEFIQCLEEAFKEIDEIMQVKI